MLAAFDGMTVTALAGPAMLVLGGLAFLALGVGTPDERVARRIALVEPFAVANRKRRSSSADYLVRLPLRGMSAPAQREVIRRFSLFGARGTRALSLFAASRFAAVAVLGTLMLLWARQIEALHTLPSLPFTAAAMAAIGGWFLPMLLIGLAVKRRLKEVRAGLPDALDLLVVCVEAGLSLEDGLERVVAELRHAQPALADELGLTLADLKILPSRDQALRGLADRVDLPSVRSVVTTLMQTLRYGTPLARSLRVVAAEMRNDYLVELEERANRLPAFMTLPVIVFLMPTVFLIVGGPAALRLLDAFSR